MKTLAEKVFERLNERNPDLLAEIIDEIESEDKDKNYKDSLYLDTDCLGNCYSDADSGL